MNLVESLLTNGQKAVDAIKRKFVVKKLKLSFTSAADNVEETSVDEEIKIQKLRLELVSTPEEAEKTLNKIVECRAAQRKAKYTSEIIEEERKAMFDVTVTPPEKEIK